MKNMKKAEHLQWIYDRLVNEYNENPNFDYMIRLRDIIADMHEQETPKEKWTQTPRPKPIEIDESQKLTSTQLKTLEFDVAIARNNYPSWRLGQTYFNVLYQYYPELADSIRSTEYDPFYVDDFTAMMQPKIDLFKSRITKTE